MRLGFISGTLPAPKIPLLGKNVYFFGDSITFGYNASSQAKRWTTLFSAYFGCIETNNGINGSMLENRSPIDALGGTNMVSRVSTIPSKGANDALCIFMFGMNDWGYNGVNYTPGNYTIDYNTVIAAAIAKGWPTANILICSPTYPADLAFTTYANISGNPAPTRAGMLLFIAAAQAVAISNNTLFSDTYTPMLNGGGASLVSNIDGIHPNDAGYVNIANTIENLFI